MIFFLLQLLQQLTELVISGALLYDIWRAKLKGNFSGDFGMIWGQFLWAAFNSKSFRIWIPSVLVNSIEVKIRTVIDKNISIKQKYTELLHFKILPSTQFWGFKPFFFFIIISDNLIKLYVFAQELSKIHV